MQGGKTPADLCCTYPFISDTNKANKEAILAALKAAASAPQVWLCSPYPAHSCSTPCLPWHTMEGHTPRPLNLIKPPCLPEGLTNMAAVHCGRGDVASTRTCCAYIRPVPTGAVHTSFQYLLVLCRHPFSTSWYSAMVAIEITWACALQVAPSLPSAPSEDWQVDTYQALVTSAYDWDVFICHAGKDADKPLALQLWDLLAEPGVGLRVFLDERSLHPGEDAGAQMTAAMKSSRMGLLLLSREFFERTATKDELAILFERQGLKRITLLPVFLHMTTDECEERLSAAFPGRLCSEILPLLIACKLPIIIIL
jgi:hypothetical protein